MATGPATAEQVSPSERSRDSRPPAELFRERESKELILAFSGAVGCALDQVIGESRKSLEDLGYTVRHIKLSDYIRRLAEQLELPGSDFAHLDKYSRYDKLQTLGNTLRKDYTKELLAEVAVSDIAVRRAAVADERQEGFDEHVPERTAYLIDQLKNPAEVTLLKAVYRDNFYLVGVLASVDHRKNNLKREGLTDTQAEHIMERDKKEDYNYGQQLDKTLKSADLFLRNTHNNREVINQQITRFLRLLHGENGITPTEHEHAMYVAFSAALQSACLSRQVGACIATAQGNILATGCNDVPKGGGGLYKPNDKPNDNRCVNLSGGKCFNDEHKAKLISEITEILTGSNIDFPTAADLASRIKNNTRLKDLIEFSRSVHAEMDAITTAARIGTKSIENAFLYTTTFPCHNCARHIVASGISRVYYIEPYEKSLAVDLHSDAIDVDADNEGGATSGKVHFLHFEGVSPKQYQNLFFAHGERKDSNGNAIGLSATTRRQVVPEYLDSYRDFEKKVVQHCKGLGISEGVFSSGTT